MQSRHRPWLNTRCPQEQLRTHWAVRSMAYFCNLTQACSPHSMHLCQQGSQAPNVACVAMTWHT